MSLSSSAVDQCRYRLGTPARLIAVRPALVFPVDAIRVGSTLTAAAPASKNSQLSNLTNVIVDAPVIDMDVGARSHELPKVADAPDGDGCAIRAAAVRAWRGRLGSRCRCCSGHPPEPRAAVVPGRGAGRLQARTASGPAANVSDRIRAYSAALRFRWKHSTVADLLKIGKHRHSRTHAGLQAQAAARLSMPSR